MAMITSPCCFLPKILTTGGAAGDWCKNKGILRCLAPVDPEPLGQAILAAEAVHPAGGIHDLLLTGYRKGCDWLETSTFTRGYSLAVGPLDGVLVVMVERVRKANPVEMS